MKKWILVIGASLLGLLCSACTLSDKDILEGHWKRSDGNCSLGDTLTREGMKLKGEKIYLNNHDVATIIERQARWYADDVVLVQDNSGHVCRYVRKD